MSDPTHNHKIFSIKAGDRLPSIEIQLLDCLGAPLDLTPYQHVFIVISPCIGGRRIVDMAPLIKKAPLTDGKVVYEWQPGQTNMPGDYLLEVILSPDYNAVPADKKLMTLPGGGYGKVVITPRL